LPAITCTDRAGSSQGTCCFSKASSAAYPVSLFDQRVPNNRQHQINSHANELQSCFGAAATTTFIVNRVIDASSYGSVQAMSSRILQPDSACHRLLTSAITPFNSSRCKFGTRKSYNAANTDKEDVRGWPVNCDKRMSLCCCKSVSSSDRHASAAQG
jgi:hypothetical protein